MEESTCLNLMELELSSLRFDKRTGKTAKVPLSGRRERIWRRGEYVEAKCCDSQGVYREVSVYATKYTMFSSETGKSFLRASACVDVKAYHEANAWKDGPGTDWDYGFRTVPRRDPVYEKGWIRHPGKLLDNMVSSFSVWFDPNTDNFEIRFYLPATAGEFPHQIIYVDPAGGLVLTGCSEGDIKPIKRQKLN